MSNPEAFRLLVALALLATTYALISGTYRALSKVLEEKTKAQALESLQASKFLCSILVTFIAMIHVVIPSVNYIGDYLEDISEKVVITGNDKVIHGSVFYHSEDLP